MEIKAPTKEQALETANTLNNIREVIKKGQYSGEDVVNVYKAIQWLEMVSKDLLNVVQNPVEPISEDEKETPKLEVVPNG